jgi:uncharacterized protein (DUF1778 family)
VNPPATRAAKDQRFNIRTTAAEKALVEEAARLSRLSASEFMLRAVVRSAEEVVAERREFALAPEEWAAFTAALDRPARTIPALRRAAAQPSPFGDG